jgi:transcriptional regulator with XRE-family HTH domain
MAENPDPIDIRAGELIRARRRTLGLSQSALADTLGVSFQQVQKYERGANRISASRLVHIARALDVAPADLLPPVDATGAVAPDPMVALAVSHGGHEVARCYLAMDQARRESLLSVARALANVPSIRAIRQRLLEDAPA